MKDEFVMVRRSVLADACSFDDGIRLGAQHALEALLAQPAEQHQGEPVTLPAKKYPKDWNKPALASCNMEYMDGYNIAIDDVAKLGPLYTRPAQGEGVGLPCDWETQLLDEMSTRFELNKRDDRHMVVDDTQIGVEFAAEWVKQRVPTRADPAEVERLRDRISKRLIDLTNMRHERDTLRAQLAEAHALLREIEGCPWVVEEATIPKAGIEAAPQQVVGTMHVGLMRLRKIRALLSASAELEVKS